MIENLKMAFWMICGSYLGAMGADHFIIDGQFSYFVAGVYFVMIFGAFCLLDLVLEFGVGVFKFAKIRYSNWKASR